MEVWKDISGFDGRYEVSSYGRIRSKDYILKRCDGVYQQRKGRDKKIRSDKDGYQVVHLVLAGENKLFSVHRLVAIEFVPGYCDGYEVNHLDGNRSNNKSDNLEWVSHLDNIRHSVNRGTHITKVRDMSGVNNPNYGNRKLSGKYKADSNLSIEKQSRQGSANGRSKSVTVLFGNGTEKSFSYIRECAEFLIRNDFVKGCNVETVAVNIGLAIKNHTEYKGILFR